MKRVAPEVQLTPNQLEKRQDLINQMLKEKRVIAFLNEHHLSEQTVSSHAQKFADWCHNLDKCDKCPGLHACRQETTGYVLELEADPLLSWEMKPCAYQRTLIQKRAHQVNFVKMDGGDDFYEADIRHILDAPADAAYSKAIKEVTDWFTQATKGLYLYGPLGTGKSYLAMAILNYFAKKQTKVAFASVPQLALTFFSSYQKDEAADRLLSQLMSVTVLVLDDIGSESYSSYFRDDVLFNLLNTRMVKKRLTLFTSNHTLEGLNHHYRINPKGDDEPVKAARIIERIQALSKVLSVRGHDRRI